MTIELDHLIVPSRNRKASAALLADILGVPWSESGIGPFCPVFVSDGLTLDFDQVDDGIPVLHYCFRVDEKEFDRILARLQERLIPIRSLPHGAVDGQVNTLNGGRMLYWSEPDGHVWELLTRSYARQPAAV